MFLNTPHIKEHFGIVETTMPKCSNLKIKKALSDFLDNNTTYRNSFLQKKYKTLFDGYSFLGQQDSTNQYASDSLHSFVLSPFTPKEDFPIEFQRFLNDTWPDLIDKVKVLELEILKALQLPDLEFFYKNCIGHMMSCNFYPKFPKNKEKKELRLSKHKDVSLFTVFLFGVKKGFAYSNALGETQVLNDTHKAVVFPGYLLEYLTKGKYKALEHQVNFSAVNEARFSFAFFSIPKPALQVVFDNKAFNSDMYYKHYLSLF